jgi:tRNA (cytidine/uridine-2'-O-)-methyltransferase
MNQQQSPEKRSTVEGPEQGSKREQGSERANSVSRLPEVPQPSDRPTQPTAHVVLYQPEIPQNTGNIGRTCVAVGAKLWIVRPAAFRIDDVRLRRAGLDYWQHLQLGDAINWEDLLRQLAPRRMFFFSRFARRTLWEATFQHDDVFIFGRETSGLPESILDPASDHALRIPMEPQVRSLNLATTVGIVLYEHQRQLYLRHPACSLDGVDSAKLRAAQLPSP